MKYLVKMTPLEAYAFGNDQGFLYPGEKGTGKESYFVRSRDIPEQTSVLGLLRYLVLQDRGLLKTSFRYDEAERQEMKKYIGEQSFSFGETAKQSFGSIQSISPLFLLNEQEEILIRNPYHNKAETGYIPMEMEAGVETSAGVIYLPRIGEYDAKNGYADGYYNLTTKEVIRNLFKSHIVSGNRKNDSDGNMVTEKAGGFFKRELKSLAEGYSFAVFAEVDRLPTRTIGYMGKKKSAFLIETKEVDDINLAGMVREHFCDNNEVWFYALSDIVVRNSIKYKDFCIVEEKYQRNLETRHDTENYLGKLKKSEIRYHLIQNGSVFYRNCSLDIVNDNCKQIGYNAIVQLGGM